MPTLGLIEGRDGYTINWIFQPKDDGYDEDDPIGGELCDEVSDDPEADLEENAVVAALRLALGELPREHSSSRILHFEGRAEAQKALRIARAALKAFRENKPWPEWALKAQAAGWKPPKGWSP
jgi:hypothetical protein